MRLGLILAALVGLASLSGCASSASFACGPSMGGFKIDAEQYTRPATTAGTGYLHC